MAQSKHVKYLFSNSEAKNMQFDGTNFDEWEEDTKLTLMFRDLWRTVTTNEEEREPEPTDAHTKPKILYPQK